MARTKKGSAEAKFIDLNLRIKQDGGPLFSFLQGIEDPYARGDRVRQLLYLGLLTERGAGVSLFPGTAAMPTTATAPASPAPDKAQPSAKASEAKPAAEPIQFAADDLASIFGTASPNLGA